MQTHRRWRVCVCVRLQQCLRQRRERERGRDSASTFPLGIGRHGYGSIFIRTRDKQGMERHGQTEGGREGGRGRTWRRRRRRKILWKNEGSQTSDLRRKSSDAAAMQQLLFQETIRPHLYFRDGTTTAQRRHPRITTSTFKEERDRVSTPTLEADKGEASVDGARLQPWLGLGGGGQSGRGQSWSRDPAEAPGMVHARLASMLTAPGVTRKDARVQDGDHADAFPSPHPSRKTGSEQNPSRKPASEGAGPSTAAKEEGAIQG